MSDVSSELSLPPNKDQMRSDKNADKSVKNRLRKVAGKVILGTPIIGLLMSSGSIDNPNIPAPNIKEPTPVLDTLQPDQTEYVHSKTVDEFRSRLKSRYGLNVIVKSGNPNFDQEEKTDTSLTSHTISKLEETVDSIPFCAEIIDELRIFKDPTMDLSKTQGNFILGGMRQESPDSGIFINIIIDAKEGGDFDLELLPLSMREFGIKSYGDYIKYVYAHECGHVINSSILLAVHSAEEHFEIIDSMRNSKASWLVDGKHDPLYSPFLKLVGGKLILAKPGPGIDSSRANYIAMREYFADLFSQSILNPYSLNSKERNFFGKIKEGFEINPEMFSRQVAQGSMMLLKD